MRSIVCNQSEENTPAVMTYTLCVITYALRRLHTNPSDWKKILAPKSGDFFGSFELNDTNKICLKTGDFLIYLLILPQCICF